MMGWVGSVPNSFGECLVECISQIIENEEIILNEVFRKVLAKSASDWNSIAGCLNGGNDSYYNLYRMGSKMDDIERWCHNPTYRYQSGTLNKNIDWEAMLEDVKWVSKIVLHEMQKNLFILDPHGYDTEVRQWGKIKEYSRYPHNQERNHA
jgi:hypothetical protein